MSVVRFWCSGAGHTNTHTQHSPRKGTNRDKHSFYHTKTHPNTVLLSLGEQLKRLVRIVPSLLSQAASHRKNPMQLACSQSPCHFWQCTCKSHQPRHLWSPPYTHQFKHIGEHPKKPRESPLMTQYTPFSLCLSVTMVFFLFCFFFQYGKTPTPNRGWIMSFPEFGGIL